MVLGRRIRGKKDKREEVCAILCVGHTKTKKIKKRKLTRGGKEGRKGKKEGRGVVRRGRGEEGEGRWRRGEKRREKKKERERKK